MKQQTYRGQSFQLLLGALLLYLAGSSLSTMYEQCRLEEIDQKTCMMKLKQIKAHSFC